MARKQSLREFQERLTARLTERTQSEIATRLGLRAGDDSWVVNLADVTEVIPPPPVTRVPHAREWFMGVTNVRGTLIGVVDWARFNGARPGNPGPEARLLILHPRHGVNAALFVERTLGLKAAARLTPEADDTAQGTPWFAGRLREDSGTSWRVLDIPALSSSAEFLDIAY